MRSPSLPPLHLMGGAYIATAMLEQSQVLLSKIYLWLMQFHSRLYHARLATPSPCPGLHPLLWPPHLCQYRGLADETAGRLAVDQGHWGHSVWHCLEPDGYFQWRTCASPTKVNLLPIGYFKYCLLCRHFQPGKCTCHVLQLAVGDCILQKPNIARIIKACRGICTSMFHKIKFKTKLRLYPHASL